MKTARRQLFRLAMLLLLWPALPSEAASGATPAAKQRPQSQLRLRAPYQPLRKKIGRGPLLASPRFDGYLTTDHYDSIRNAAVEIMKAYPPDEFLYVGIGRAPTSLVAFFQELGTGATTLPASGLRGNGQALVYAEYRAHFNRLIGEKRRRGRKILFLDRAITGGSIAQVLSMAERWAAEITSPGIAGLGLLKGKSYLPVSPIHQNVNYIDASQFPQLFLWGDEFRLNGETVDYDEDIGQYDRHVIGEDDLSSLAHKRNPLFKKYKMALRKRMVRDDVLNEFLHARFAHLLTPND